MGLIDLSGNDEPVVMLEKFAADPTAHPLKTPSGRIEISSATIEGFAIPDCPGHPVWIEPAEWLGNAPSGGQFLHLVSDQPAKRLHSQMDSSAWSQAAKIKGREPVYINPQDAAARGIAAGDIVELSNRRGRCLAGAVVSDVVMAGVVRLSTGAWYDPDPETGLERHGNPNTLTLDVPASGLSQGCAAHTCLVELKGPIVDPPAVLAFQLPVLL
jgi:biotin/methionine sulfoxide reductase